MPERFTSDGPRRMFLAADGTPAPQTRAKPDFTAADGVSTSVPDFEQFFGTSAAAPGAAGIAALVRSGNPTASIDGTWTFKVTDGAASDTGSVRAFTLSLTGFVQ